MVELIKGLASVRDGLTLIAFLSLVLLLALRTKKVLSWSSAWFATS